MARKKTVALYLTGPRDGPPTLDDLIALARLLTGRDPTADEIAEARRVYLARDSSAGQPQA